MSDKLPLFDSPHAERGWIAARDGFPAYIAAIRKVQPKIWVCENVKGLPELDEKYFNLH